METRKESRLAKGKVQIEFVQIAAIFAHEPRDGKVMTTVLDGNVWKLKPRRVTTSQWILLPTDGISSIFLAQGRAANEVGFTFQSNFAPAEAMAFSIKGTASGHALDAMVRSC